MLRMKSYADQNFQSDNCSNMHGYFVTGSCRPGIGIFIYLDN